MTKRLLVLLFVFALVAAACSSDDATDSDTTTTAAAGEDATTTTAAAATTTSGGDTATAAVTVRWRTRPDNDQEAAVYQSVSDDLQGQLTDVTLVYEAGGTETEGYQQALLTQLAAGDRVELVTLVGGG